MAAVRQGMSVRKASFMFGVPRRTVADHASGKIPHFNNSGTTSELTEEEEVALVDYITYMSQHNMPLHQGDIRSTIIVSFHDLIPNMFKVQRQYETCNTISSSVHISYVKLFTYLSLYSFSFSCLSFHSYFFSFLPDLCDVTENKKFLTLIAYILISLGNDQAVWNRSLPDFPFQFNQRSQ